MIIDTSALVALLLGEPEAHALARAIAADPKRLISAVSALETAIVIEARKGPSGGRDLDLLLHRAQIEIMGMDAEQVQLARRAYEKYGKGRHPAGLNLGIAAPTRSPATRKSLCFSREMTSARPIFQLWIMAKEPVHDLDQEVHSRS